MSSHDIKMNEVRVAKINYSFDTVSADNSNKHIQLNQFNKRILKTCHILLDTLRCRVFVCYLHILHYPLLQTDSVLSGKVIYLFYKKKDNMYLTNYFFLQRKLMHKLFSQNLNCI